MVQIEVKKKTRMYGASAVLLAIVLVSMVYVIGSSPLIFQSGAPAVGGMKSFSSNQELVNYLNTANNGQYTGYYGSALDAQFFQTRMPVPVTGTGTTGATGPSGATGATGATGAKGSESSNTLSTGDHSTTNIQVQGVDEADTVKTDGQYIYTISNTQYYSYYSGYGNNVNSVYIVSADTQNPKVVAKIDVGNDTQPAGLFLSSDSSKLVVIASKYQTYYPLRGDIASSSPAIMPYYSSDVYTFLYVYDISNKAQPTLTRNFTATGSYFNSRMIGDNVYAIVSQTAWVYNNIPSVPKVYDDGREYAASPTTIYYADMNDTSYSFTSFYGLNVKDGASAPTNMTVLMGGASAMYVSPQNIYITYSGWDETTGQYNAIYRVAINGLELSLQAQGSVPGYIINQYAMDEYNGYFRVATNYWSYDNSGNSYSSSQINNVYVLNQNLNITGKLEGLAPNENLHSARFMGNKCYLVTYQTTDPLFVIDLSDPTNPKVLGELKIPGYSDYLHPYDETHLIGVGKDADLTDDGSIAYYQGIKLALFDVSNVNNPTEIEHVIIGDRGTQSEALNDPKAFLFDKSKNLLVIPISLAVVNPQDQNENGKWAYGQTVWQGAYVYTITTSGLELRGTVTHLNPTLLNAQGQLKDTNSYWETQNQWITRSLYIGNTLYTISSSQIKLNNLSDLSAVATVNLV